MRMQCYFCFINLVLINAKSLLFQLFFVDRVVHYKRSVERVFPLLKGWTSDALREIEKKGFGRGFVDKQFQLSDKQTSGCGPSVAKQTVHNVVGGDSRAEKMGNGPNDQYNWQVIRAANTVAGAMSNLMTLIIDAPPSIRHDERFNNLVQSSSYLLGVKGTTIQSNVEKGISVTHKLSDVSWGKLEWQNCISNIMEVFEQKQKLLEHIDYPSFSLGLTQMGSLLADSQSVATKVKILKHIYFHY